MCDEHLAPRPCPRTASDTRACRGAARGSAATPRGSRARPPRRAAGSPSCARGSATRPRRARGTCRRRSRSACAARCGFFSGDVTPLIAHSMITGAWLRRASTSSLRAIAAGTFATAIFASPLPACFSSIRISRKCSRLALIAVSVAPGGTKNTLPGCTGSSTRPLPFHLGVDARALEHAQQIREIVAVAVGALARREIHLPHAHELVLEQELVGDVSERAVVSRHQVRLIRESVHLALPVSSGRLAHGRTRDARPARARRHPDRRNRSAARDRDVGIRGGQDRRGRPHRRARASHDRRRRALGDTGLGRRPHPLRRAGHLGLDAHSVVLARRDHRGDGQLRRRLRAGASGQPRVPDQADGGRRGHSGHGARRGHLLGVGELPRVSRRGGADPARARHRRAGAARRAALLRDGRARRRSHSSTRRPKRSTRWDGSCAMRCARARSASRRRARATTARATVVRRRASPRPRRS